ncbi:MAG: YicC/YloC family endoribonuclease [Phycisphaerales bacterium]
MIRSMTGFGEASVNDGGTHYFLEVRSLNNKYFKCTIRLPEEYQGLEAELESELRRKLTRGTITLIGKCSEASASAAYRINQEALANYVEQVRQVSTGNGAEALRIDLAALLPLPGVLQPPADEEARLQKARTAFLKLLEQGIARLVHMRELEGRTLVADLMSHHGLIVDRLAKIAERTPAVVDDYQKRLQLRIETLLDSARVKVEPADLLKEVAIFAERSDIAEEIARLGAHMDQFKDLLGGGDPKKAGGGVAGGSVGRTLDFLAQEMLREANTIASKSGDALISRNIVEIKGAIDRIKEQVQNAE